MIAMIESDLDTSSVQNERQEEKKARWAWSDYITWEIKSASAVAKETCSHMTLMRLGRAFSLASWQFSYASLQALFQSFHEVSVRIMFKWINQRKSELNNAWSLKIAITEY